MAVLIAASFLGWYLLFVAAAAFARHLMAYRLLGAGNVALLFGLSQVAVAFVIAWRHGRYCREVLDPLAAQIVADAGIRVRAAAQRHGDGGRRAAAVRARPGAASLEPGSGPGRERRGSGPAAPVVRQGARGWPARRTGDRS